MPTLETGGRNIIAALGLCVAASLAAAQSGNVQWVRAGQGHAVPAGFAGGYERGQPLFVCRGPYANGVYPGKIVNGICDISYGNREIALDDYEVLVGSGGQWGAPQPGYAGAFVAGGENGAPLFLCQSPYEGGLHPGKVYDNTCHISYGGREVPVYAFSVLYLGVQSAPGTFNYPLPPPWGNATGAPPMTAQPPAASAATPAAASCSVGPTKFCGSCSITCMNPDEPRPQCQPGVDAPNENAAFRCVQSPWCFCTR
ncbi:MAG: DM9 repeat-containing protein [Casimicrobiaceae bacterium]